MVHLLHRLYGVDAPGYTQATTADTGPVYHKRQAGTERSDVAARVAA